MLELRNLTVGYAGEPVLRVFSLALPDGGFTALIGPNGCGKSTLLRTACGLLQPSEGQVLLDGVNLNNIAIADVRKSIGIVSQEIYIFKGTVAENIAYAKPGCTKAEIVRAAVCANAHDFICRLTDGYDTVIGLGGHALSGGERQRISIARATPADPTVLILDEATSSIDTRTEIKIQNAFAKLMEGRTSFIVAHRLSTIREADIILVMKEGKIIEKGNHKEVMKKGGFYAELYNSQFKL